MTSVTALLIQERQRQDSAKRHLPAEAARLADAVFTAVDALYELDPNASPASVHTALKLWFDSRAQITTAEDAVLDLLRDAGLPAVRHRSGA